MEKGVFHNMGEGEVFCDSTILPTSILARNRIIAAHFAHQFSKGTFIP
jgi:hypothetical protein